MARGGYVSIEIAVTRLAEGIHDKEKARALVIDALASGQLTATGSEVSAEWKSEVGRSGGRNGLRKSISIGNVSEIPRAFWGYGAEPDLSWSGGNVSDYFGESTYRDVKVREKELNALIARCRPQSGGDNSTEAVERRKRGNWDECVAALVCLGAEQRITGHITLTALREAVADKLEEWGLDLPAKPQSTFNPLLRAVVDRYRSHPPALPKLAPDSGKP